MDRVEILNRIIDLKHINFSPSNGHLLYYAGLTDKQIKEELNKLEK